MPQRFSAIRCNFVGKFLNVMYFRRYIINLLIHVVKAFTVSDHTNWNIFSLIRELYLKLIKIISLISVCLKLFFYILILLHDIILIFNIKNIILIFKM